MQVNQSNQSVKTNLFSEKNVVQGIPTIVGVSTAATIVVPTVLLTPALVTCIMAADAPGSGTKEVCTCLALGATILGCMMIGGVVLGCATKKLTEIALKRFVFNTTQNDTSMPKMKV